MKALVNPAALVDPLVVLGPFIVEPQLLLDQGVFVGRIPVHLVGAHVNEHRLRSVKPRGLQEVERTQSGDFKIYKGDLACLVVRGLSRTVDYQGEMTLTEE